MDSKFKKEQRTQMLGGVTEKKENKKVLIISFYFPPANVIGALRVGKLAKYLRDFGWEPWVLTLEKGLFNISEDLLVEIDCQHIIRADMGRFFTAIALRRKRTNKEEAFSNKKISSQRSLKQWLWTRLSALISYVRFPDLALPWYLPALRKGNILMRDQHFDAILSSHCPPGSHVVAAILAKRNRVPWVAEFRDLWTQNHSLQNRGKSFQWLEERLEKHIMRRCHSMITVSAPLKEQLEQLHRKSVVVITNGFDHEDYPDNVVQPRGDNILKIVYTGTIYNGKQDPSPLFQAIKELIRERLIERNCVRIEFYGANPQPVAELAAAHEISDVVSMFPRIRHEDVIKKQVQADILLLLEWTDWKVKGFYSGKVFEYLGAKKPVLAVGPKGGVIDALLLETRAGVLVSTVAEAKATLKQWLEVRRKTGRIPYAADFAAINRYTRRAQAEALAQVLNSTLQPGGDQTFAGGGHVSTRAVESHGKHCPQNFAAGGV